MAVLPQAPIAVNATGGAKVALTAKTWARGFTIQEDASGAGAGLAITWPDGNTTKYGVSQYPIVVGNIHGSGSGPFVGKPANSNNQSDPATTYCNVVSLGSATEVLLTEYN
jgi:hypothetical protein